MALLVQRAIGSSAPAELWLAAPLAHLTWLVAGFSVGAFGRRPVLARVGMGRILELMKELGDEVEWLDFASAPASRVDGIVVDPEEVREEELLKLGPSLWTTRTLHVGQLLEDARGRVELAAWSASRIFELRRARRYEILKRLTDLGLTALLAPPTILVGIGIAIAIRLESPGPVFFKQERTGKDGVPFQLLKFRSMTSDDSSVPSFTDDNDSRITRVGHIIRQTRLDELPQLLNVLAGSMSLVGPRPEQVPFVDQFRIDLSGYDWRHSVRPGLTGWAQVEQGYVDSIEGSALKLEYDLYYATRRSLLMDWKIILRTPFAMLTGGGAR